MVICPGLHPLSPSAVPNTCTYIWKTIREQSLRSLGRRRREIMGTRKPETDDISASICSLIDIREEEESVFEFAFVFMWVLFYIHEVHILYPVPLYKYSTVPGLP